MRDAGGMAVGDAGGMAVGDAGGMAVRDAGGMAVGDAGGIAVGDAFPRLPAYPLLVVHTVLLSISSWPCPR